LLRQVFTLLANEANQGVLGRMFDGALTKELRALFSLFLELLAPRARFLDLAAPIFWDRGEVALRESLCLEDRDPLERALAQLAELELDSAPIAWLENHRELELSLCTSSESRAALTQYAIAKGGALGRNNNTLASRIADMLDNDPQRIALAMFTLYMLP